MGSVALNPLQAGKGGNGNGGGKGGGGGSSEPTGDLGPVCLLFCDTIDPNHLGEIESQLLDGLQNPLMVQSDLFWNDPTGALLNANEYCDGRTSNIYAEITQAGGNPAWLLVDTMDKERPTSPRRTLFVDFQWTEPELTAALGRACTLPDWFEGATTTAELEERGWETHFKIRLGAQTDNPETGAVAFDLLAMATGETRTDVRLGYVLIAKKAGAEMRMWIHYHDDIPSPTTDIGQSPSSDWVNVTRLSATQWLVVVPEDRVASVKASDLNGDFLWHGYYRFPGAFLISQ